MILILFLLYYYTLNDSVPQFFTDDYITRVFLKMKLDKQIIPPYKIVEAVKLLKDHKRK